MRQFDVCRNKGRGAARSPYLLVLQRHWVDALPTRLVAPVMRLKPGEIVSQVMVGVDIEDESLHVSLPELFSIDRTMLGAVVGNWAERRDEFVRALDVLVTG